MCTTLGADSADVLSLEADFRFHSEGRDHEIPGDASETAGRATLQIRAQSSVISIDKAALRMLSFVHSPDWQLPRCSTGRS